MDAQEPMPYRFSTGQLVVCLLAASPALACMPPDYKEVFRKLDANRNGLLDEQELKGVPTEYRKAVLVGIDADGDHRADEQEYVKYREEDSSQPKARCEKNS
jgi:hypothetical protein